MFVPRGDPSSGMGADHIMSHRTQLLVVVFLALGVYNAAEVFYKIFRTFQAYRGVYFWALIAASIGIVLHALGYFFRNFSVLNSLPLEIILVGPGGMMMITGQSVVLYSRLHLISRGRSKDRWLLALILVDLLVVQVGATILYAGSQSTHSKSYLPVYKVWERFQVTSFFIQECVISGLYIYRTYLLMQHSNSFRSTDTRGLLIHLAIVNVLVILLDVTILACQYTGLYEIQTSWKTLAYSVKLKFEFHILNRLIELTKEGLNTSPGRTGSLSNPHITPGGRNAAKTATHVTVGDDPESYRSSPYVRMGEDKGMPLEDLSRVVVTKEISVTVEDDNDDLSESSTRKLRNQKRMFR